MKTSLSFTTAPRSTEELSYCPIAPSDLKAGEIDVDWGDGTRGVLRAGASSETPRHAYPTDDGTRYRIVLSAEDAVWAGTTALSFGSGETFCLTARPSEEGAAAELEDDRDCRVRFLVGVDSPLPVLGFTSRAALFAENRLLERVPDDLFSAQAAEIESFEGCFLDCRSLECPSKDLFEGCVSAKELDRCFCGCANLKSAPVFPEGFFDALSSLETADGLFQGAWIGDVATTMFGGADGGTSRFPAFESADGCFAEARLGEIEAPIFDGLPALACVSEGQGCFAGAALGNVRAPLLRNLPVLEEASGCGGSGGCFAGAELGDVKAPLLRDLPALKTVSGAGDGAGCFSEARLGAVEAPVFEGLPKVERLSGRLAGCFQRAVLGEIRSPLFAGMPELREASSNGSDLTPEETEDFGPFHPVPDRDEQCGCFSCATVGNVCAPIFSDLPNLRGVSGCEEGSGCFYGASIGDVRAPIFSNLPELYNISAYHCGCFKNAEIGDVESPFFRNCPSLSGASGEVLGGCFQGAGIGGIYAPIFSDLPALEDASCVWGEEGGCFLLARIRGVSSPIFENCPELRSVSGDDTYSGCFCKAQIDWVDSPIFSNLPKLETVSGNRAGCFSETLFGSISSPIFEDMPNFAEASGTGGFGGCFSCCSADEIGSPIFSGLPKLKSVNGDEEACFGYAQLGDIEGPLFENCPALAEADDPDDMEECFEGTEFRNGEPEDYSVFFSGCGAPAEPAAEA